MAFETGLNADQVEESLQLALECAAREPGNRAYAKDVTFWTTLAKQKQALVHTP